MLNDLFVFQVKSPSDAAIVLPIIVTTSTGLEGKCAVLKPSRKIPQRSVDWNEPIIRSISSGNVVSSQVQTSTYVNRFAGSSEVAGELLVRAINDAVAGLDFELAAQEVKRKMASR